jgi:hypothetical protein
MTNRALLMILAIPVLLSGAGVAAAMVDGPTEVARAAPTASGTSLSLSVRAATAPKIVTLTCDPAGGTHPHAADACTELGKAGGDFDKLPPTPNQMCPHIVQPVTASAEGTYRGKPVGWSQTFNNTCEMNRATAPLFQF